MAGPRPRDRVASRTQPRRRGIIEPPIELNVVGPELVVETGAGKGGCGAQPAIEDPQCCLDRRGNDTGAASRAEGQRERAIGLELGDQGYVSR